MPLVVIDPAGPITTNARDNYIDLLLNAATNTPEDYRCYFNYIFNQITNHHAIIHDEAGYFIFSQQQLEADLKDFCSKIKGIIDILKPINNPQRSIDQITASTKLKNSGGNYNSSQVKAQTASSRPKPLINKAELLNKATELLDKALEHSNTKSYIEVAKSLVEFNSFYEINKQQFTYIERKALRNREGVIATKLPIGFRFNKTNYSSLVHMAKSDSIKSLLEREKNSPAKVLYNNLVLSCSILENDYKPAFFWGLRTGVIVEPHSGC